MKCKKLTFKEEGSMSPTIVMGIILSENSNFIVFRTARREYTINKLCILSMRESNIEFRDDLAAPQ